MRRLRVSLRASGLAHLAANMHPGAGGFIAAGFDALVRRTGTNRADGGGGG